MMTLTQLTTFFGWVSVINAGLLIFAAMILVLMRGKVLSIHSRMLGIPESDLLPIYIQFLGNYKILLFVFSLAPYIALKLMGN